jgi:hypothetical protein
MTRLLAFLFVALLAAPSPARAGDLTLRDVIELHRTGLGDELLIAVIEADGGPFTLSFADIQDLKSDGLSERVIAALARTRARQASFEGAAPPVVHVTQEVVNYIPIVVVSEPAGRDRRHGPSAGPRDRPVPSPPPASWVTRREDGKNVAASGEVRRSKPGAAWVTPRDPQARESQDEPVRKPDPN